MPTKASDIMNTKPATCLPDTSIETLSQRFADEKINGLLVLDDNDCLLGVVTASDLVEQERGLHMPTAIALFDMVIPLGEARFEAELKRLRAMNAADLMATGVQCIAPNTTLANIAELMGDEHIHFLPVVDDDNIVGVVSRQDVMRSLTQKLCT
ncbi:MAG: CBS domain-containing protein [Mariprofundales bacterium]